MGSPFVSVCVPVYNEEKTIKATIASILCQSIAGEMEVLVCLNGCTDNSAERVREMSAHDDRVRIIRTSAKGKPNAWNLLRGASRGKRLVFMDGDVVVSPRSIERLLEALETRPDLVGAGAVLVPVNRHKGFLDRITVPQSLGLGCLCGRLYAVDAAALDRCMASKGFSSMPQDILAEDLWVSLIIGPRHWQAIPEARVIYQHPSWRDLVRIDRRNVFGVRQLRSKFPQLFRQGKESPSQRARRWALTIVQQRSLSMAIWRTTGYIFRRICTVPAMWARPRHLLNGVLVLWDTAPTSKESFDEIARKVKEVEQSIPLD